MEALENEKTEWAEQQLKVSEFKGRDHVRAVHIRVRISAQQSYY